jgi:hypothetical protein
MLAVRSGRSDALLESLGLSISSRGELTVAGPFGPREYNTEEN